MTKNFRGIYKASKYAGDIQSSTKSKRFAVGSGAVVSPWLRKIEKLVLNDIKMMCHDGLFVGKGEVLRSLLSSSNKVGVNIPKDLDFDRILSRFRKRSKINPSRSITRASSLDDNIAAQRCVDFIDNFKKFKDNLKFYPMRTFGVWVRLAFSKVKLTNQLEPGTLYPNMIQK